MEIGEIKRIQIYANVRDSVREVLRGVELIDYPNRMKEYAESIILYHQTFSNEEREQLDSELEKQTQKAILMLEIADSTAAFEAKHGKY